MRFPILCVLLALFLAPVLRADAPDLGAVPDPVREDLMHGRWEAAVTKLEALATSKPDDRDLWLLLAGIAHDHGGRAEQALAALRQLEREHPDSVWVPKSRFRQAEIHRARGEYAAAEKIYEDAVRHLRSPERQGELAAIYVEYADEASTSPAVPTPGHRLDYDRAYQLYAKVLELEAPRALRDRTLYRMAVCMESSGNHEAARQRFDAYLAELDPARQRPLPAGFLPGERLWEARLHLGRAELATGRGPQARRTFEDLAADLTGAIDGGEAPVELRGLVGDARYDLARTYGGGADGARLAIAAYGRYLDEFPTHPRSTVAAFAVAELQRGLGRLEEAIGAYQALVEKAAPGGEDTDVLAEHERLTTRALYLKGFSQQAQAAYTDAIATYEAYARRHPSGPDWSAAQQGIVDARFQIGADHRAQERFAAAREAWIAFLGAHPLDHRAAQIQFDLGQMKLDEAAAARRAAEDADVAALLREAIDQWTRVVQKYPGSQEASRGLYQTGFLQETELGELEAAIESYTACDFGNWAGQAQARLRQMIEPSLELVTERSWRTDEPARVKLRLRNVEEVEVARYALDLEAYFRKHLTHRRVEELDLDLIEPDERTQVAVEDYARYAPLEQEVDLGLEGPGVWAIAVTAGELRATTLVLRSDVDVIVKSSRREVFVFAQDVQDGGPREGVRVLLALPGDGDEPTLEELVTGADGVARHALEGLKDADELRVLAVREGHYASDGLTLSGLSIAQGLSARGHLATDRSAYRPGDRVRWRAIVRGVEDGSYHFTPGARVDVEIRDSQGRPLQREVLALSEFGTVHGELALPEQAPLGGYVVQLSGPDLPTVAGSFQVQQYQLQKVELTLDAAQEVVYRGEEVVVTAKAAYYYGEPVVDSPLAVQLPDGRLLEARTDARGEFEIRFGTRDFLHEGALQVAATLREEGVTATGQVWLATHGYRASLSTAHEVVLAGDSFPVTLATTSPAGEDVSRRMTVEVLRRESAPGGQWREVSLESREVTTSEENGQAHLSFALEEGGTYRVRATGTDRFANPVLAELGIFVSGDEDSVRLRLLSDTSRTKVGEELVFELVNRAGAGLALVTFEGETILGYRLVQLAQGRNELKLQVGHEHFPNVALAAAMMRGNELFQAASEFDVARELVVKVAPRAGVVAPGGEAEVELLVTDQLGRPVRAELCLAVVDASLFDLYPDPTPALGPFFEQGARRQAGLRTTSSCTFAYQGVTTRIDQAVLDETLRAEAAQEWRFARVELEKKLAENSVRLDREALTRTLEDLGDPVFDVTAGLELRAARGIESLAYRGPGDSAPASRSAGAAGAPRGGFFFDDAGGEGADLGLAGKRALFERRVPARARDKAAGGESAWGEDPQEPARPAFDAHTAFWSPAVVSDEAGHASLRFELPDKATRWRLTARGTSAETLVGEAQAELLTRSEFFAELLAPLALVEGDRPRLAARVHNLTGRSGRARLNLTLGEGDQRLVLSAEVTLDGTQVVEHRFGALEALAARDLKASLTVSAQLDGQPRAAGAEELLRVRPRGLELSASASGEVADATTLRLELPPGARYADRRVELFLGPSAQRALIDEALGRAGWRGRSIGTDHAAAANDLVGACALLRALEASGRGENPEYGDLRRRAQGLVAALAAAQNDDGGWPWIERGSSQLFPSVRAALGLAAARGAGLAPPEATVDRAADWLVRAQREAPQAALERKAAAVDALAALDREDFAAANALHRERNRLSPAALAHTALALARMDRAPMAADVARLLEPVVDAVRPVPACDVRGNEGWNRDRLEMSALAALALEAALPGSAKLDALTRGLLASRPWGGARGRGLAVAACARHASQTERLTDRARVTVRVGDAPPVVVQLEGDQPGQRLVVPLEGEGRRVAVSFELEGRARPHVSAVLRGYTDDLDNIATDVPFGFSTLEYLAEAPRYRGRELPVGFEVLNDRSGAWTNTTDHLPLGRTTRVRADFWRTIEAGDDGSRSDYLVLEVPLPAGARVLEGSFSGALGLHHLEDGALVAPLGTLGGGHVEFTLLGVDPGAFRVRSAVLRSAYEPGRLVAHVGRDFEVLARGEASPDEYRPTPDELFHHGQRLFADGDLEGAHARLNALHTQHEGNLRTADLRTLARTMLTVSLGRRDPAAAVRFFEVLREKDPAYTVPFDQIVAIGEAYRDLGEFERAYLIFRATALETFGKDLEVAGTLQEQGERAGALDALDELTLAYPDLPAVVEARLALADQLLALAPGAHREPSLVKAGYDRAALTGRGVLLLERFLALHPTSSLAPDAGLNLVSAYLGLEDPETAASLAGEMAGLYTQPRFADAFLYTQAVAQWHLGRDGDATGLLERIASAEYTDERGRRSPSENRDLALYILGQIAHARQDAETAEEYYERVEDQFADAREALAGFRRRSLALEEVTTARPGEAVSVDLTFQNLEQAEVAVYAVDLMTLYLREKDLSRVTAVNLAGIAPTLTATIALGEGRDLRSREGSAQLALSEPGAYLVIARSGALHASGLVLVSDLELEVVEDPVSGRVRVQALDSGDGRYLKQVDVRVVGSSSGAFVNGETDPRGLFVADGVAGTATVVARQGDHYAFHRGQALLAQVQQQDVRFSAPMQADAYYQNVLDLNGALQMGRVNNLNKEISRQRDGVQLQQIR